MGRTSFLVILFLFIKDPGFRILFLLRLSKTKNFCSLPIYAFYRFLCARRGILIPRGVTVGAGCYLGHAFNIIINQSAEIGKNVNIAHNVTVGSLGLDAPKIGNNVYIGPNCVIFGNIVIGDNTIIGAGAIVNRSFRGNGLLVGNPAIKKKTSHDVRQILKNVRK